MARLVLYQNNFRDNFNAVGKSVWEQVCIPLGHRDVMMPQQFLHFVDSCSIIHKEACKCVP